MLRVCCRCFSCVSLAIPSKLDRTDTMRVSFSEVRSMRKRMLLEVVILFLAMAGQVIAQANGKLQIHYIDVGQGDGALLISPKGETVLFDGGVLNRCDKPISYLQQLGVSKIDYLIISHYHSDHIGCTPQELQEFPLQKDAVDRGFDYTTGAYKSYKTVVGSHRA